MESGIDTYIICPVCFTNKIKKDYHFFGLAALFGPHSIDRTLVFTSNTNFTCYIFTGGFLTYFITQQHRSLIKPTKFSSRANLMYIKCKLT